MQELAMGLFTSVIASCPPRESLSVGVWIIPSKQGADLRPVSSYAKCRKKARVPERFCYRNARYTNFAIFVEALRQCSPMCMLNC
jgi:hypothetical protein